MHEERPFQSLYYKAVGASSIYSIQRIPLSKQLKRDVKANAFGIMPLEIPRFCVSREYDTDCCPSRMQHTNYLWGNRFGGYSLILKKRRKGTIARTMTFL